MAMTAYDSFMALARRYFLTGKWAGTSPQRVIRKAVFIRLRRNGC